MHIKRLFVFFLLLCTSVVSAETLSYTLRDGQLIGPHVVAATGYVEVRFHNESSEPYDIVLERLADGKTKADLVIALDAVVEAFANPEEMPVAFQNYYDLSSSIGGVSAAPGATTTFGVLLEPGTHIASATCTGCPPSADNSTVLNVTEGASAAAPTPDLTVELGEFHVHGLPAELSAGTYLWEMQNTGQQGHYLGLFRLAKGKTQEDFLTWMASAGPEGPSGPPPGEMAGGSSFITGGQRYFYSVELTPGRYVVFCPVQDIASGMPHDALGMRQALTVK